jgi:hypothetical protein
MGDTTIAATNSQRGRSNIDISNSMTPWPRNEFVGHIDTASGLHHGSDIGTIGPRGVNQIPTLQL